MVAKAIDQAIGILGNANKLAKALDVSPQTVYRWKRKGYIPGAYAYYVAEQCGGWLTYDEIKEDTRRFLKAKQVKAQLTKDGN